MRPSFTDVEWMIIASDGLWHLMDNKDVIRMAGNQLTAELAAARLMSEIDTNTRSQLKGHDNCVILAVRTHTGAVPIEYRVTEGTL